MSSKLITLRKTSNRFKKRRRDRSTLRMIRCRIRMFQVWTFPPQNKDSKSRAHISSNPNIKRNLQNRNSMISTVNRRPWYILIVVLRGYKITKIKSSSPVLISMISRIWTSVASWPWAPETFTRNLDGVKSERINPMFLVGARELKSIAWEADLKTLMSEARIRRIEL